MFWWMTLVVRMGDWWSNWRDEQQNMSSDIDLYWWLRK